MGGLWGNLLDQLSQLVEADREADTRRDSGPEAAAEADSKPPGTPTRHRHRASVHTTALKHFAVTLLPKGASILCAVCVLSVCCLCIVCVLSVCCLCVVCVLCVLSVCCLLDKHPPPCVCWPYPLGCVCVPLLVSRIHLSHLFLRVFLFFSSVVQPCSSPTLPPSRPGQPRTPPCTGSPRPPRSSSAPTCPGVSGATCRGPPSLLWAAGS